MHGLVLMIWAFVSVFIGVSIFALWLFGAEPMTHDKQKSRLFPEVSKSSK